MPGGRLRDDQTPPLRILEHWPAPEPVKDRSLTSLKEKLIKIGAKVISHGRYAALQMAKIAISWYLFADILRLIAELRLPPAAAST